ncbi:MAG TPA: DUF192 domain-containing protein [Candidatus Limnocylindria bacterium]|jgi:uncharacterized membrane protein (UPF0127 family)
MARYVRVENKTRGTVISTACRVASSLRDRNVGLLGTDGLEPGTGLLIERGQSIHMFFMRFAIDAVFINKRQQVTKIAANLRPWRMVLWAFGARDCLELPAGTASATGTRAGDQLALTPTGEQ